MNLSEYSEFILLLAEKSAKIIRSHFFNPKLLVETKPDDSPVSQADKEAEELCIVANENIHEQVINILNAEQVS